MGEFDAMRLVFYCEVAVGKERIFDRTGMKQDWWLCGEGQLGNGV